MGIRSVGYCENRSNNDNGSGYQRRWKQIRYVGEKLCGTWRQTSTNSIGWSKWLCNSAKDYEQIPENQKLRTICIGCIIRVFPSIQIPRFDECTLPVCDPSVPLQLSRTEMRTIVGRWIWIGQFKLWIRSATIRIRCTTSCLSRSTKPGRLKRYDDKIHYFPIPLETLTYVTI